VKALRSYVEKNSGRVEVKMYKVVADLKDAFSYAQRGSDWKKTPYSLGKYIKNHSDEMHSAGVYAGFKDNGVVVFALSRERLADPPRGGDIEAQVAASVVPQPVVSSTDSEEIIRLLGATASAISRMAQTLVRIESLLEKK